MLDENDKLVLLKIARETLDSYIGKGKLPLPGNEKYSAVLLTNASAFVSLHKNGNLRGCIGRFHSDDPLHKIIRDMTISASTKDIRFKPLDATELDDIDLEISVLTPMIRIQDPSEIKMGKHGIYIKKGINSGTFLPQVATETGWNLEEYLGHCARDKAGIGWKGWKDAELYIYEAIVFKEEDYR